MAALAVLPDSAMVAPWSWRTDGEVLEVRDALHRSLEAEMAQLAATRAAGQSSEAVTAMTEADRALGDLGGLLTGQSDSLLDTEALAGEWTLREVLHHMLKVELNFAANTGWAVARGEDDPVRLPGEERKGDQAPAEGTIAELLTRLRTARDATDELVDPLLAPQLELPTVWTGHAVDVRFRIHRFASHLIEHTIQVEKVLHALGRDPQEARQEVRAIWATRGAHRRWSSEADLERLDLALAQRTSEVTGPASA